ncbi:ATP-binding protein [Candidatus Sumerlaeota bacterium]|nr:ATP-binding protein [Candidatus Sumerlaeota bacterium]
MRRLIMENLQKWKDQRHRKPLILRGARQVGKTWAVINFGNQFFDGRIHVVNLEKRPDWHRVFDKNFDIRRILMELEILMNTRIIPGKDLLFLDEIQSCPKAITSLRYFHEETPELHVIGAGSLLEYAMRDIPFPIGRAQFLNLHPMNFVEFLLALGKEKEAEIIVSTPRRLSESVHNLLLEDLRNYMFIGGMPECVQRYVETGNIMESLKVHSDLAASFREDFPKYAPYSDKRCLNAVFSSVARSVGRQIKYSRLSDDFSNPTIKKAFDLLCLARVIRRIPSANPSGLPLGASVSSKKFKALMVDIGLMQSLCGMALDTEYSQIDLLKIYKGALAEQFAGQEFISAGQEELYYWDREAKSSSAEVDFLLQKGGGIYPVEVKSGASGRLKSLHLFLKTYPHVTSGYIFSCASYAEIREEKMIFLPLYYAYSCAKK